MQLWRVWMKNPKKKKEQNRKRKSKFQNIIIKIRKFDRLHVRTWSILFSWDHPGPGGATEARNASSRNPRRQGPITRDGSISGHGLSPRPKCWRGPRWAQCAVAWAKWKKLEIGKATWAPQKLKKVVKWQIGPYQFSLKTNLSLIQPFKKLNKLVLIKINR